MHSVSLITNTLLSLQAESEREREGEREAGKCVPPSKVMKEAPYSLITQGHQACVSFLKYLRCSKLYLFVHTQTETETQTHVCTHSFWGCHLGSQMCMLIHLARKHTLRGLATFIAVKSRNISHCRDK